MFSFAHLHSTTVCSRKNMTLLGVKTDLNLTVMLSFTWLVLVIKQVNVSDLSYFTSNS